MKGTANDHQRIPIIYKDRLSRIIMSACMGVIINSTEIFVFGNINYARFD